MKPDLEFCQSLGGGQAGQLSSLVMDLMQRLVEHFEKQAATLGLSGPQAKALLLLLPGEAVPMSKLAEGLQCDASNITGIVDRLELRGALERKPSTKDRRIKLLALTADGAELRAGLFEKLFDSTHPIAGLSQQDQEDLLAILRRMLTPVAAA